MSFVSETDYFLTRTFTNRRHAGKAEGFDVEKKNECTSLSLKKKFVLSWEVRLELLNFKVGVYEEEACVCRLVLIMMIRRKTVYVRLY